MNLRHTSRAPECARERSQSDIWWNVIGVIIVCCVAITGVLAQSSSDSSARLTGTVFVLDSQGRSYISNARVVLSGAVSVEAQSDKDGRFNFAAVPPGAYKITVEFSGL